MQFHLKILTEDKVGSTSKECPNHLNIKHDALELQKNLSKAISNNNKENVLICVNEIQKLLKRLSNSTQNIKLAKLLNSKEQAIAKIQKEIVKGSRKFGRSFLNGSLVFIRANIRSFAC